jgi:hypothetical protein
MRFELEGTPPGLSVARSSCSTRANSERARGKARRSRDANIGLPAARASGSPVSHTSQPVAVRAIAANCGGASRGRWQDDQPRERREITPRSAAGSRMISGGASMRQRGRCLAHVNVARAFPERLRTLRVTLERLRGNPPRSSRRSNGRVPFSSHSHGGPVRAAGREHHH